MPAPKFWAYVKMMPVLQAQRSIASINEQSLAFGSMEKTKANEYVFNLNAVASKTSLLNEQGSRSQRVGSPQELAASIPGMQIVLEPGPKMAAKLEAEKLLNVTSTQEFADR